MATENDLDLELDDIEMDLDDITDFQDISPANPEGVWVKSGPEDVPPSAPKSDDSLTSQAPAEPADNQEDNSIFGEEDSLSAEELAKLGDSFDFVEASSEPLEGESIDEERMETENLDLEDMDSIDLEMEEPADAASESVSESSTSGDADQSAVLGEDNSSEENFDEISLDDFVSFDEEVDPSGGIKEPGSEQKPPAPLSSEEETQEEFLDIDIDIEDEVPDSELEIYEEEKKNAVDEVSLDEFLGEEVQGAEEVDIADFGDFEVEDISDEEMGFDPETPAQPSPTPTPGPEDEQPQSGQPVKDDSLTLDPPDSFSDGIVVEESSALGDDFNELSLDEEEVEVELGDEAFDNAESDNEELVETDDYFEDIPLDEDSNEDFSKDFEETLSMEKEPSTGFSEDFNAEAKEYEEIVSTAEPDEDDMDSITALEKDLTKGIDPLAENNNPATAADAILQKIENELSSIKNELGDLKKEISGLRSVEAAEPGNIEGGFFKEDEDETIALTGEELDNILTSADITEDAASIEDDLISTDEDGKIVDDIPQSDEELFQGTDLQSSLEDEVELPDSSGSHPLPGGDGFAEAQMPLEEELQVASKDPSHTIPEEIELVEEQSAAATDQGQEKIETEDLLGESPQESQPEEAFEVTDNTLPDMNDVNNLNMSEEEISSEEINFEEGDASINLDTDFESVDLDQMEGEQVLEEEESLEIPFDEELSLEEDNIDVPNIESPGQTETTDAEKQADAAAASEAFPEPTLGQGAETKTADAASGGTGSSVPESLRNEIANVLKYMDNLLDALPDEKIQEFAESEHFEVYKKLFEDLGLME